MAREEDLERIRDALDSARSVLARFTPGQVAHTLKEADHPVTAADLAVNETLRRGLPRAGEGWLSEESADDLERLGCRRVWVVDPIDGTRHFIDGIPEWCVSVALVEDGRAVAGGIANLAAARTFVGSLESGAFLNGEPCRVRDTRVLEGAEVLASRSEVERGEWERLRAAPFRFRPVGSVAYKLALVAGGLADATWSLVPKHEWDVAAGVALVQAAGGVVWTPDGTPPRFNQEVAVLPGLFAAPPGLVEPIRGYLEL